METMLVTYHVSADADEIEGRAQAIALEQTVELPLAAIRSPFIAEQIVGKVESIEPLGDGRFRVCARYAADLTGMDAAQMANVLFGNTSMQPGVTLVDANLPDSLLAAFGGPRHGIEGLRALTNAWDRPLTCTALKPVGLTADELADLCRTFARAGIDVIKDDHGLADQHFAPFAERVQACQRAVDEVHAETGRRAVYAPNLMGGPNALRRQAELAVAHGVQAAMIAPMLLGLSTCVELLREHLPLAVLAHPTFIGVQRIDPAFQLGRWFRLLGADAVIFANYGGRFSYSTETCRQLADNLRDAWGELKPALPTPAGGMQVDSVDEIVAFYGADSMLLIGGSLYVAGDALLERSRTFVENVHTALERVTR